jgi:hypothetical protein
MEFLTKRDKQKRTYLLFVSYSLLGILTLLLTYILVSNARGYEIFSQDGNVVQNGLLFVDSKPEGADIYINGVKESDKTNAKLSLAEGSYSVKIQKDGYETWEGTVPVLGGEVLSLSYPKLVAKNIRPTAAYTFGERTPQLYDNYTGTRVVATRTGSKEFVLFSLNGDFPTGVDTGIGQLPIFEDALSLEFVEWSRPGEHILLKVLKESAVSYAVCKVVGQVDCQSLPDELKVTAADEVRFWASSSNKLMVLSNTGDIHRWNIESKAVEATRVTIQKAARVHWLDDERFVYVEKISGNASRCILYTKSAERVIGEYSVAWDELSIDSAKFNRNEYVVIGGATAEKTYVYKNIQTLVGKGQQNITPHVLVPASSRVVSISQGGRFILASNTTSDTVYDLQKKELSSIEVAAGTTVQWLDDSRLLFVEPSKISVSDFDGMNRYDLAAIDGSILGLPITTTDGQKVLWLVSRSRVVSLELLHTGVASQAELSTE